jgi:dihydroxyacetone kinase-like predicted kinase
MREQVQQRDERLAQPDPDAVCGAVAVSTGDGMRGLFASLGVTVLDGGPTLNPSTFDLLAAIHALPTEDVVVLPNSPNVVMAAERAAELSDRNVCVVPSHSLQAGLAAAVSLDPGRSARENAAAMCRTLEGLRTGAVAPAARDDGQGRFRAGEAVGFVADEIVAWGDPRETLGAVLAQLADGAELITCLRGADAPLDDAAVEALLGTQVELEQSVGGQPSYWWLLSAE